MGEKERDTTGMSLFVRELELLMGREKEIGGKRRGCFRPRERLIDGEEER